MLKLAQFLNSNLVAVPLSFCNIEAERCESACYYLLVVVAVYFLLSEIMQHCYKVASLQLVANY